MATDHFETSVVDVIENLNMEEIVMTWNVPVDVSNFPIATIVQPSSQLKKSPHFDYLIKSCDTAVAGFSEYEGMREEQAKVDHGYNYHYKREHYVQDYLSPITALANSLGGFPDVKRNAVAKTLQIVQLPQKGQLVIDKNFKDSQGGYGYLPNLDFIGDDKIIFSARYNDRNYKIVINIHVRFPNPKDTREGETYDKLCPVIYSPVKLSELAW